MSLAASQLVQIDEVPVPGAPFVLVVSLGTDAYTLDLHPVSVRSDDYQLLVAGAGGVIRPTEPGVERTFRGTVREVDGAGVAASVFPEGLYVRIMLEDDRQYWIEPLTSFLPDAPLGLHVVYKGSDVRCKEAYCGTVGDVGNIEVHADDAPIETNGPLAAIKVAELAADADVEYYNRWGRSEQSVEARITSVINAMNVEYERDVEIRHIITKVIVRTQEPDPYCSSDSVTLLTQFRNEWVANQGHIRRDVAKLFTDRDIDGDWVGKAWKIGSICSNSTSYCYSYNDYDPRFSCATDLAAHELGHLWNASHCDCPSHTMNPLITCTNIFHPTFSIPVIQAYRDTLTCLVSGPCGVGEESLTQSVDNRTITAGNSVACSADGQRTTTENSFARCFPLNLGQDIEIESVEFGVEAVNVNPQTIKIKLWRDTNGCPPNTGNAVLIAERPVTLEVGVQRLIRVDFCGTVVTDGTSLIVDIDAPDMRGVSGFLPGSNALGQTGPTYLKSASCQVPDWRDIVNIGFPNMMLIQTICYTPVGEPDRGTCCLPDGSCEPNQTRCECHGFGGEWRGANVTCQQANCQEHTGGCCRDGVCTEETRTDCEQGGGCKRNPEWRCDGDVDGNGVVNPVDVGLVQAAFSTEGDCDPDDLCQFDIDCNGVINPVDSGIVQSLFGQCRQPRPPCGGRPAGEFLGYDTTCADSPCALGACCEEGVCTGTTREEACNGRWHEGEDCDQGFQCPTVCTWDNNIVTNGVTGRGLSPPAYPNYRVVDDFNLNVPCVVSALDADVVEDFTWTAGNRVTVTVRRDSGGAPVPGAAGILAEQTVTTWTRTATGATYFGRADYKYSVTGLNVPIPNSAKYWIGLRNPLGGGSGTNYWVTSDGGPDGMSSSTGYFSLDAGASFQSEGAGFHHSFIVNP
jgi:hypothetical protein